MKAFWLCFVPLFVAVDPLGVLPIYMGLVENITFSKRRHVLLQFFITASAVSLAFLTVGPAVLALLGITVSDFMVAGGVLLFAISLMDLLTGEKRRRRVDEKTLGAVPLGVPIIVGPAVFTISVVLANMYTFWITAAALLTNIFIAVVVFRFSDLLSRLLGNTGLKILSKIASLLLASIAVMLIRQGIFNIVGNSV